MSFPYLQYWMFVAFNVLAGMGILAIIQALPRAVRAYVGAPGRTVPPSQRGDRPAPDRRSGAGRHTRAQIMSSSPGRDAVDVLADGYQAGQNTGDLPAVRTDPGAYAGSADRLGSIRIPGYAQYQPSYGADLGMGSHALDKLGTTFNDATDPEIEEGIACPRCGAANWGQTRLGQPTCVNCGYIDDEPVDPYGEGVPPGLGAGVDL